MNSAGRAVSTEPGSGIHQPADDHHHVTVEAADAVDGMRGAEDKQQAATDPHEHTERLLPGDRLLQYDGGQQQDEDRHAVAMMEASTGEERFSPTMNNP